MSHQRPTMWATIMHGIEDPSPALKQSATAVAVVVAAALTIVVPGIAPTNATFAIAGLSIVAIATVLAGIISRVDRLAGYVLLVPVIDLIGIGAFRAGTGGGASAFSALILLPVVWIAVANGRRYIALAGAGAAIALTIPNLLSLSLPTAPLDYVRGLFSTVLFTVAAAIVNQVALQSRVALGKLNRLAEDKESMLQRTVEYAAQLQESEAKYRSADRLFRGLWAAVTEQAVIGTDSTGLIDAWNPGATKILGPSQDEAEDKMHIFDFHLTEELEDRARELNYPPGETVLNPGFSALVELARLGKADVREWTWLRVDGTPVPVEVSVTKRVDEGGRTVGYLFVASDVTKQREVARLKDEFVGLISHELRTPLSSILGYLELMRDDEQHPLSAEHLQYLSVAERNANRLLRLVGDLLFTAQVESGRFPLDSRDTALAAIVLASIESGRPMADAAGVELVSHVPAGELLVHGDPVRLGQAIDNLISNAIKFTPRGGIVTVALEAASAQAVISVSDTGMGIPASDMDQLFSRFFRATTATRNAVPGVGLGLTITKAIVTAHEGEMAVESEEGVGTRFSMRLPLVTAPVAAAVS
ncbi:ATP-binding protein [Leifsonia sp. H3M29-4]|uniref:sensor histidine kinase n=1 Tax=Salinibacterium metalliresistens TaxID=3031321 RepID=UPI0023D9F9A1|nr:ATP-binding protein [Salinibacterium metalliresistens]MDF1479564.1 ATP-binding protein [Salinibacterium metalliresistens]